MPLHREHILVTGAAGFIGSHLVERLLSRGVAVTGIDNFDPFYAVADKRRNLEIALAHPSFRFEETDCTDLAALDRMEIAHRPFTAIVHLAAKAGVRPSLDDPIGYMHANVIGTQVMLEFARRRRISRFVFGSSSSVYGNDSPVPFAEDGASETPISPYAASKRAGELLCATHAHLHGTAIIALRFFTVYGPRQRPDLAIRSFATKMLDGKPLQFHGDGSSSRDYTWIDDIIDGIVASLARSATTPGECVAINLGGSRRTTLSGLVELLESALGVPARLLRMPKQPGDVDHTFANTSRAARLLGYAPRTPITEGIPRFAEWLRQHRDHSTIPRVAAGAVRSAPLRMPG